MPKLRAEWVRGVMGPEGPTSATPRGARSRPPSLEGFTHLIEIGIGDPADVRVQLADAACAGALQASVTLSGVRRIGRLTYAVRLDGRPDRARLARIVARLVGPALTEYDDYDLAITQIGPDGTLRPERPEPAATGSEPADADLPEAATAPGPVVTNAAVSGPAASALDIATATAARVAADLGERLGRLETVTVERLARIDGAVEATVAALPTQLGATAELVERLAAIETRLLEAAERPGDDFADRFDRLETLSVDGFARLAAVPAPPPPPAPVYDDSALTARLDDLAASIAARETAAARRSGDIAAALEGLVACEARAAETLGDLRARAAETAGTLDALANRAQGTDARFLAVAEASVRELAELRVDIARLAAAQLAAPTVAPAPILAPLPDPAVVAALAEIKDRVATLTGAVTTLAERPAEPATPPMPAEPAAVSTPDPEVRIALEALTSRIEQIADTVARLAERPVGGAVEPAAEGVVEETPLVLAPSLTSERDSFARVLAAFRTILRRFDAAVVRAETAPTTSPASADFAETPTVTGADPLVRVALEALSLKLDDLAARAHEKQPPPEPAPELEAAVAAVGALSGRIDALAETVETRLPPVTSGPNLGPERESLQRILAGLRFAVRDLARRGEEVSTVAGRLDAVATDVETGLPARVAQSVSDTVAETLTTAVAGVAEAAGTAGQEVAAARADFEAAIAKLDTLSLAPPAPAEPTAPFDRVPTEAFAAEKARFERLLIGYRLVLKQLYETVAAAQGGAVAADAPSQAVDIEAAMNAAVRQVREEIAGQFAEGLARLERAKRLGPGGGGDSAATERGVLSEITDPTTGSVKAGVATTADAARALARFATAVESLDATVKAARAEGESEAADPLAAGRLETAADEVRAVLGELLSVAAALSRDIDANRTDHTVDTWARRDDELTPTRTKRRKGRGALI